METLWEKIYDILLDEIYADPDDGCIVGFGEASSRIEQLLKEIDASEL